MPRDNRKENREKAKAENENKAPDGTDLSDLLKDDLDVEEEDADNFETGNVDDNEDDENASHGEGEKKSGISDVNKEEKSEEDGEKKEDSVVKTEADDKSKEEVVKDEKTDDEKKAEEKAKEEPIKKPEPTVEELALAAAKAKEIKDAEDAAKAKETPKILSDEEATKLFLDWREVTEDLLAKDHYKLSEADVAELNENPAAYIPKAMSRVYLDSISAAFQQFVQYLPNMVFQVLEQKEKNRANTETFFTAWPDLKAHEKGLETVHRLGTAYRAQNPGASMEDWINEVGAQAMVALRLTPKQANGHDTKIEEKKPFKPAQSGGGAETPKQPQNPFAQLAEQFGLEAEEDVDDS